MRQTLLFVVMIFITNFTYSQVTIYYDDYGNITMKELATHYRMAHVDTVLKKFTGEVRDYWANDSVMIKILYDEKGIKNGAFIVSKPNGQLKLKGQYTNGKKSGSWQIYNQKEVTVDFNDKKVKPVTIVDSLERRLTVKENFTVGEYIRRRDYPEIYSLISRSRSINKSFPINGDESKIFTVVEQHAYFPNGMKALGEFVSAFIHYPEEASKNGIKGQVIIEFFITEDGSINDFKIIKGLGYGCDEEAIRVLKLLPDWVPGYQNGRAVKVKFKLPITFG